MDLLALILGAVLSGSTVIEYGKQPLDIARADKVSTPTIQHVWFSSEDQRQAIIQKAYDLWWLDFVLMIECENGNRDINAVGDSGKAHGLCQMNTRRHKLPKEYYTSWEYQVEYCYDKWKWGTKFYWPNRKINGQTCKNYVKSRFIYP